MQIFGTVDWAPSDILTAFLLAGLAQSCRRRAIVEGILGMTPPTALNARACLPISDGGAALEITAGGTRSAIVKPTLCYSSQ